MDQMPFLAIILQSIPESIILLCLGLASMGKTLNFKMILPVAVLSSVLSWFVRMLPLPYGVHTFIGVFVVAGLFVAFLKLSLLKSLVASLFAFSCLVGAEAVLLPFLTKAIGIASFKYSWSNSLLRIALPLPILFLLGTIVYFMVRFKISFESLVQKTEKH
ncbi:MAG: hypothetical protein JG781_216 [Peptococcaceae bacterium]|nr:hypothetical protein [Peptococcaceae bacterium]